MAQSVLDMARALGLTTVAEGVEDAETAASLRAFGCDYGQGFFYSPLSAEDMLALLKSSGSDFPTPRRRSDAGRDLTGAPAATTVADC